METTTTVNKLWFFAIVSECVLNYRTGLINRAGSPFAQFRKQFPDCPANKRKAILWINDLINNIPAEEDFRKPTSLERLIKDINENNAQPVK